MKAEGRERKAEREKRRRERKKKKRKNKRRRGRDDSAEEEEGEEEEDEEEDGVSSEGEGGEEEEEEGEDQDEEIMCHTPSIKAISKFQVHILNRGSLDDFCIFSKQRPLVIVEAMVEIEARAIIDSTHCSTHQCSVFAISTTSCGS